MTISTTTTWSTTDKSGSTLSNGNLTVFASGAFGGIRANDSQTTGQYYWECTVSTWGQSQTAVGVSRSTASLGSIGSGSSGNALVYKDGSIQINGSPASGGPSLGARASGNVIGIALDMTNQLIWFRVAPSGNWNGSPTASPAAGTGGVSISAVNTLGALFPSSGWLNDGDTVLGNFGAAAFTGTDPFPSVTGRKRRHVFVAT